MKLYLKVVLSVLYWFTKLFIIIPMLISVAFTPLNYVGMMVIVSVPFVAYKNLKMFTGGRK